METNPVFTLQKTLLHIIDTAALSEKMSNFSYESLEAITNFVLTGRWETKMLFPPSQPQNSILTHPRHFDYSCQNPYLSTHSAEVERVESRLAGFVPKESKAWEVITQLYGSDVKQIHLRAIAEDIAANLGLRLDRDAKRRKTVLIKWFDENWDKVLPMLNEYKINGDTIERDPAMNQSHTMTIPIPSSKEPKATATIRM